MLSILTKFKALYVVLRYSHQLQNEKIDDLIRVLLHCFDVRDHLSAIVTIVRKLLLGCYCLYNGVAFDVIYEVHYRCSSSNFTRGSVC